MHFHVIKLVNHFQLLIKLNRISHPNLHIRSLFLVSCPTILPKTPGFCYNGHRNEKVFRDPVHNYIHVNNQIIYNLINTKEFQRFASYQTTGNVQLYLPRWRTQSLLPLSWESMRMLDASQRFLKKKYPEEWNPC